MGIFFDQGMLLLGSKRSGYESPNREFCKSDERVRFYIGLQPYGIVMVMFQQTAPHVDRQTQTLDKFEEFVLLLMKLKLNMPSQDLAY